jgi:hypothetical protein
MNPVFAILVTERFADPIVSLPSDAFRKREPVHLRSAITGKIGSPVTIRQRQIRLAEVQGTFSLNASSATSRSLSAGLSFLGVVDARSPVGIRVRCQQFTEVAGLVTALLVADPRLHQQKCLASIADMGVQVSGLEIRDCAMFERRSTFAVLLLSCLACWLSCAIVLEEIPELLSLTDNTSNDFTVRKAASAERVHVLRVEKQSAIKVLARAAEQAAAELWKRTFQATTPTRSALFIVNSVLRT